MMREIDKNYVGSIAKGMNIFSFIANSNRASGITHIAKALNLSIGAVQRGTHTLQKMGYLRKDEGAQGYILGNKAWGLGLAIVKNIDLKQIAHPYLKELSAKINETVNLAILDGTEIVYVDRIKTEQIININLSIGSRLPVYCTSMGKSLLAFLSEVECLNVLETIEMNPITKNTITDKATLMEELYKVRKQGFSVNNKELDIGLRSVAAPVRGEAGKVIAAVNIAVPSSRITLEELKNRLSKKVKEVTRLISESMGYQEQS